MSNNKNVYKGNVPRKVYIKRIKKKCNTQEEKLFNKLTQKDLQKLLFMIEEAEMRAIDRYKSYVEAIGK